MLHKTLSWCDDESFMEWKFVINLKLLLFRASFWVAFPALMLCLQNETRSGLLRSGFFAFVFSASSMENDSFESIQFNSISSGAGGEGFFQGKFHLTLNISDAINWKMWEVGKCRPTLSPPARSKKRLCQLLVSNSRHNRTHTECA